MSLWNVIRALGSLLVSIATLANAFFSYTATKNVFARGAV